MINHELAEQVLDKIRSYPENFDMGSWESTGTGTATVDPGVVRCGTTLCVAGWTDQVVNGYVSTCGITSRALQYLGLDRGCEDLFYTHEEHAIKILEVMSKPDSTVKDVEEMLDLE